METRKLRNGTSLPVPFSLGIEDGYLVYDQTVPTYAIAKPTMLEDFLVTKTDQDVLDFARKWGTLREPTNLHPHGEVLPLDVRCAYQRRIGLA